MASRSRVFVDRLTSVFAQQLGSKENVYQHLQKCVASPSKPMILMGGDQLTGKSTLGKNLARLTSGAFVSVGELFREAAAKENVSVAELARSLRHQMGKEPQIPGDGGGLESGGGGVPAAARLDVMLDLRTCELVGGQQLAESVGIIEGRQPAFMGMYMEQVAGKKDCVSVYLRCSPRERALRFLKREVSLEAAAAADKVFPDDIETGANGADNVSLDYAHLLAQVPGVPSHVVAEFADNAQRDADDRARYQALYSIDYGDMSFYDTVVDTSNATAEENMEKTVRQLLSLENLPRPIRQCLEK